MPRRASKYQADSFEPRTSLSRSRIVSTFVVLGSTTGRESPKPAITRTWTNAPVIFGQASADSYAAAAIGRGRALNSLSRPYTGRSRARSSATDRPDSWFVRNEPRARAPVSRRTWRQVRARGNHPRGLSRSVLAAPCVGERSSACALSYRRGCASRADCRMAEGWVLVAVPVRGRVACRCHCMPPDQTPPKEAT